MITIKPWFIGGPLHGQINENPQHHLVRHQTIEQPDYYPWVSMLDGPIQSLPITEHTYTRRHMQFAGHEGHIWTHDELDMRDVPRHLLRLMDVADWVPTAFEYREDRPRPMTMRDASEYAWGGVLSSEYTTHWRAIDEWELRTRPRTDAEGNALDRWLNNDWFEETVTGLTHNMRWTPGEPDDPDANRSHP